MHDAGQRRIPGRRRAAASCSPRRSPLPLVKGDFDVYVHLGDENGLHVYDRDRLSPGFSVRSDDYSFGLVQVEHSFSVESRGGRSPRRRRAPLTAPITERARRRGMSRPNHELGRARRRARPLSRAALGGGGGRSARARPRAQRHRGRVVSGRQRQHGGRARRARGARSAGGHGPRQSRLRRRRQHRCRRHHRAARPGPQPRRLGAARLRARAARRARGAARRRRRRVSTGIASAASCCRRARSARARGSACRCWPSDGRVSPRARAAAGVATRGGTGWRAGALAQRPLERRRDRDLARGVAARRDLSTRASASTSRRPTGCSRLDAAGSGRAAGRARRGGPRLRAQHQGRAAGRALVRSVGAPLSRATLRALVRARCTIVCRAREVARVALRRRGRSRSRRGRERHAGERRSVHARPEVWLELSPNREGFPAAGERVRGADSPHGGRRSS